MTTDMEYEGIRCPVRGCEEYLMEAGEEAPTPLVCEKGHLVREVGE